MKDYKVYLTNSKMMWIPGSRSAKAARARAEKDLAVSGSAETIVSIEKSEPSDYINE